jgi:hypothetical protein
VLTVLALAAVGALVSITAGGPFGNSGAREYPSRPLGPDSEPMLVPPPPIDDEYFPCEDCHEDEPADPEVRELDEHDNIELAHGDLWCLDCHDGDQRDLLHLPDASPVEMAESWRLCSRCHAKKMPDWRAGVHGKRTGNWRGPKEQLGCVTCHAPHAPLFEPLKPKPPPTPAWEVHPPPTAGFWRPAR